MNENHIRLFRISYYENDKLIQTDYKLYPIISSTIGNKWVVDLLFVEATVTPVSKIDTDVTIEVEVDGQLVTIEAYGEDIIYAADYGKEEED